MTTWHAMGGDLRRRPYPSYAAYCAHQGQKRDRLARGWLETYEARYAAALQPRLAALHPHGRVLCLGARGGAEVRVFTALGCHALGLDVNPGPANPNVMPGDFHALPYQTGTLDFVFTNALDHAYDLRLVLAEVHRVLVPGGAFIVEAGLGTTEGGRSGTYESVEWATVEALVRAITQQGFTVGQRVAFDCPWPGEQVVCQRTEAPC